MNVESAIRAGNEIQRHQTAEERWKGAVGASRMGGRT